jgi:hypothetical protein
MWYSMLVFATTERGFVTRRFGLTLLLANALVLAGSGCDSAEKKAATLTRQELLDPETCKGCHPKHYREWSSSMHAYAARDPVFLAMNRRGQRETKGELGDFCVRCHAPMAVREGAIKDFADLSKVPAALQGVTCYFCHNAVGVGDHFNGDVKLANDTTLRASISDAVEPSAHGVAYSPYHDRDKAQSARLCGSCHDVKTPQGVHLERTFQEYEESLFSKPDTFASCQSCHMDGRKGFAAVYPGVKERVVHEHTWPGVDVALTEFPHRKAMQTAVESCALPNSIAYFELQPVASASDDAPPLPGAFTLKVTLETNAGHRQPSGSAHDRRMWLELIAYDENDEVLFESGTIGDREIEQVAEGEAGFDPNLWLFRDHGRDARGRDAHMFWDITEYDDREHPTLPTPASAVVGAHSLSHVYFIGPTPARVVARLRMRPIGLDILEDLVASGDLDRSVSAAMPTFTVDSREARWPNPDDPSNYTVEVTTSPDCNRHVCMYDPAACSDAP